MSDEEDGYSEETRKFLQEVCQSARLSLRRQDQLFEYLDSKPSRRTNFKTFLCKANAEPATVTQPVGPSRVKTSTRPRLRTKEAILRSGCYERDRTRPEPRKKAITDFDKDALAFKMAYGREMPEGYSFESITDLETLRKSLKARMDERRRKMDVVDEEKRFHELIKEIQERQEFLEEMGKLGKRHHEQIISQEMARKLKELDELLGKAQ